MCVTSTMDCCRVCARHSQEYISIYGEEAQLRDLAFKLRFCLHMNVSVSDNLPSTLCWKCAARLDTCYEFMQEHLLGQEELQRQQYYLVHQQRCASPESGMYDESDSEELKVNEPMVMEQQQQQQQPTSVQKWQPKNFDASSRADNVHIGNLRLCKCERCTLTRYGSLPLVVDDVDVSPSSSSNDDGRVAAAAAAAVTSSSPSSASGGVKVERPSSVASPGSKKELSCDFCSKLFTHAGDLKKHRRTHTGEKPYECPDCHKMFSHTSNLVRHRKIHSGERPYTCPVCRKAFGRSDKMLGHIKTAHPSHQIPQPSS